MTIETRAQFARRLGVNRSTVTRAAEQGRLVLVGDRIDVEASLLRWEQTKGGRADVAARHAANRSGPTSTPPSVGKAAQPAAMTPSASDPSAQPDPAVEELARVDYKRDAVEYENKLTRLERELVQGKRYTLDDVKRESLGLGGTLRSAIDRVIDQTAPRLAVMPDAADRAALLRAELRKLRHLVRNEFPRSLRRLRKTGAR